MKSVFPPQCSDKLIYDGPIVSGVVQVLSFYTIILPLLQYVQAAVLD